MSRTFFINREYNGIVRRVKIETNDIGQLFLKVRIIANLKCSKQMGLKPV